jgi:hypothetical protein
MGYINIEGEQFYVESIYYHSTYEGNKRYRERNRDKINARQNKDRRRKRELSDSYKKYKTEVKCICGSTYIDPYNKNRHFKTVKHNRFIEKMNKENEKENEISCILDLSIFDTEENDIIPLQGLK